MIGFVCGTGYEDIFPYDRTFHTPYGKVVYSQVEGIVAVNRHMRDIPPHRIPYKAIVYFFKKKGIRFVIGASAVGSLRKEIPPGSLVIPSQLVDFCGVYTFHDNARIHAPMREPFSPTLRKIIENCLRNIGENFVRNTTYICNPGPQFETLAEVKFFSQIGDIIGMTVGPEAKLFREMNIEYQPICVVTNFAGEDEDHERNVALASQKSEIIKKILFCAKSQNL